MPVCRSCQAAIIWCQSERGKTMPVDAEPSEDGTLVIQPALLPGDPPRALYVGRRKPGERDARHRAHFATCPQASHWRR